MMHKAWSSIEEVPYCFFQCHLSNFKVARLKKSSILTQIGHFRTVTPVRIHWWLWNDAQSWSNIEEVPNCFSRSHQTKIANFDPNWAFPECNLRLNLPMALKWCTKLEVAQKRCPIVFQGHPSNFKVTWDKKSPILSWIESFWTVTLVWIHWWIWNDAQSLM